MHSALATVWEAATQGEVQLPLRNCLQRACLDSTLCICQQSCNATCRRRHLRAAAPRPANMNVRKLDNRLLDAAQGVKESADRRLKKERKKRREARIKARIRAAQMAQGACPLPRPAHSPRVSGLVLIGREVWCCLLRVLQRPCRGSPFLRLSQAAGACAACQMESDHS